MTDGVVILDKPAGVTSFRAVQLTGRVLRERKCGHAGTLDPMATGVLPVCAGRATKIAGHLAVEDKDYEVEFRFGTATDTGDVTGKAVETVPDASAPEGAVAESVAALVGTWEQTPPAYSALKVGGTRAYVLARKGQEVELAPRTVHVRSAELLAWSPEGFRMRVSCSKGFYVRSLSRDMGRRLGVPMAVSALRRTRCGPFRIEDAVTIEDLKAAEEGGALAARILPIPGALSRFPQWEIPDVAVAAVRQGRSPAPWIGGREPGEEGIALLLDPRGDAVALVSRGPEGLWGILRGI